MELHSSPNKINNLIKSCSNSNKVRAESEYSKLHESTLEAMC